MGGGDALEERVLIAEDDFAGMRAVGNAASSLVIFERFLGRGEGCVLVFIFELRVIHGERLEGRIFFYKRKSSPK